MLQCHWNDDDDDESDQSYRYRTAVGMYGSYGNNCQTAHPTRAPPPTTESQVPVRPACTAQQSIATSMTMSRQYSGRRMFHSPAVGTLWGRRGPAESVFRTQVLEFYAGVEKNAAMMMSRTYWYRVWQHSPSPARPTTAGIGTGTAVRSYIK